MVEHRARATPLSASLATPSTAPLSPALVPPSPELLALARRGVACSDAANLASTRTGIAAASGPRKLKLTANEHLANAMLLNEEQSRKLNGQQIDHCNHSANHEHGKDGHRTLGNHAGHAPMHHAEAQPTAQGRGAALSCHAQVGTVLSRCAASDPGFAHLLEASSHVWHSKSHRHFSRGRESQPSAQ